METSSVPETILQAQGKKARPSAGDPINAFIHSLIHSFSPFCTLDPVPGPGDLAII